MKNKILRGFASVLFLAAVAIPLFAQDTVNVLDNPPPDPEASSETIVMPLSRLEFTLSIVVLVFGLVIILLEIYLIKNRKISAEDAIKFVTITLIITSTLFLITAGYSNDQIAPAVGLLGTIAGYLLGRMQNSNPKDDKQENPS
jgi:hypothetical protein